MTILDGIRAVGSQRIRTRSATGETITIDLRYLPSIQMWYIDISTTNFFVQNIRLNNNFNMLHQFQNIIDFGIGVLVSDGGEPFLINDLSTGRVQIAVLSEAEVEQINAVYVQNRIA